MVEVNIFYSKAVKSSVLFFFVGAILSSSNALSDVFFRTNNDISINLYHEMMNSQVGNFVYGIFPLDALIALAYLGAKDDTAREMKSAFGWNVSDDQIKKDFTEAIIELEHVPQCKIYFHNSIYVTNRLDINPKFHELASLFDTKIAKVDFSSPKKASKNINSRAVNSTHKKLGNWISEKELTPQTDLVFVNNIFLRARWLNIFDKKVTEKMDFHISKNETVKVDMMKTSGYFMVFRHPTLKINMVKLPFKNEKLYMVIMIADDIDAVDSIGNNANQLWNDRNFTSQYITLYLPKFEVTSTIDMIPTLKHMGITKLFSTANSGITKEPAKVSVITQKIYFGVEEIGTAADDLPILENNKNTKHHTSNEKEEEEIFKVDHPFVFGILYDNDLSLIFGRINKI